MSAPAGKNWLEWTVFGVGAALVLGLTGYLGVQAAAGDDRAPDVRVTLGPPEPNGEGFAIPVELQNAAAGTAMAVTVVVAVERGGTASETTSIVIDYLPGYSRRTGRVALREDPRDAPVAVRSLSYALP